MRCLSHQTAGAAVLSCALICAAGTNAQLPLKVESGSASFHAGTTVHGVEVTGKSSALTARVLVTKNEQGITLGRIDASLPARSLTTGMKVRDEHMRNYIFKSVDGTEPDIRFTSEGAACPPAARSFECPVAGEFQMRGVTHPFQIALHVKEQSETSFRVEGDGIIKLSDYGIAAPSQFGVKMLNEVKFHIDFKTTGDGK